MNRPGHPRRRWGWAMAGGLLALSAMLCGTSLAATDTDISNAPVFELVVRADQAAIAPFLTQHLALQRYRALSDLDEIELSRLLRDADTQARELLATLGFFNPQLRWTHDLSAQGRALGQVQLDVSTGPPARIAQVQWHWQGDVAENPMAQTQQQDIVQLWALPPGETFTQTAWNQAKNQALRQLVSERYPWGRLVSSQARIDTDNNRVHLDLTLDSGPSVRLGSVQITGADKYGAQQVERLARLLPGKLYRQSDLLEAQQRLVVSGFYDSVFVSLDPEAGGEVAPVKVELKESLRQKWVLGLGMRSDSGARVTAEHTHHSIPGLHWRAVSKVALDRDLQSVGLDLLAPPDSDLWRWNTSLKVDHEKRVGFQVNSQRWRAGRTQLGERIDRSYFAQYDSANQMGDIQGQKESISGNYAWIWRDFDSLPFPNRGLGLGVEVGTGVTLGSDREPYARWLVRGLAFMPLGKTAGRLALRAEMGSVVSRNTVNLPTTQLFLTGGDNSVRGYAPNSIGVTADNGLIVAGRYLASGSVEWQRPIVWNQQRTDWESAIFADAGAVTNAMSQVRAQIGYGVGARWRSPVGPVRMDLAYAQSLRKLRLHLSVGFTF
ncbi:hypothetical protein B9Z47_04330 [Limnohabitans sp. 2KL-1]|jgi:translocation and assembly module TamA|uniref:autotransporter assembly complex protein TamA n=1 Tax=Limnohabitans sp. 2KL-1 TaxID=1100699 RepID=UPI000D398BF3|nr:BamA/TamA family outer membrane protein [Limnohabitans sp. 2KL-1]PUE50952.1 hypothetical protein B9Z47_04330 [Limnohabitans sp. 2KL-1]